MKVDSVQHFESLLLSQLCNTYYCCSISYIWL